MTLERSWVTTWNASTRSMRCVPLIEHLKRVNAEIVAGIVPTEHAIAVLDSLEEACGYEREMKRVFRKQTADHRPQTEDHRPQTADHRLQTEDRKL